MLIQRLEEDDVTGRSIKFQARTWLGIVTTSKEEEPDVDGGEEDPSGCPESTGTA